MFCQAAVPQFEHSSVSCKAPGWPGSDEFQIFTLEHERTSGPLSSGVWPVASMNICSSSREGSRLYCKMPLRVQTFRSRYSRAIMNALRQKCAQTVVLVMMSALLPLPTFMFPLLGNTESSGTSQTPTAQSSCASGAGRCALAFRGMYGFAHQHI